MKENQEQGILNWVNTKHVNNYLKDGDGVLYVFQKPCSVHMTNCQSGEVETPVVVPSTAY